jgi:multimeric flavodoxin WrbA
MKILGVCCSPRKGKSTFSALDRALSAAREFDPSISTTLIELAEIEVKGCIACGHCVKVLECSQKDGFNALIPAISDPEIGGMIIATPVYFGSMSSLCKAFLDRCVMFRRNGFLLRNRVGGVIAVGGFRNGGQEITIQTVQAGLLIQDMVLVGDGRPGAHLGGTLWSGQLQGGGEDEEGTKTAVGLGRRVAEVALRIK